MFDFATDSFPMFLPILIFVAVAIPVAIFGFLAQQEREDLVAKWAADRGYDYLSSNPDLVPHLRGEPYSGGYSAKVKEFISGRTAGGHPFCSFKYSYEVSTGGGTFGGPHFGSFMDDHEFSTGFGGMTTGGHNSGLFMNSHQFSMGQHNSTRTVEFAIIMMRLPAELPDFRLTYEGIGDKVQKFFGGQDIELESDDFNRFFRVQSPVEAFAYGVLHPRMMEWLMGPASSLVPFSIDGPNVFYWRDGSPHYETLDKLLTTLSEFIDQIPQGVFEQHGRTPQPISWAPTR